MNKSAIKKFAIEARTRLIEQVEQKAFEIGITANETQQYQEIDGHLIVHGKARNGDFKRQREQLISAIETKGFEQVMEEMAYTWFNRFISLRFMEVNGYLPIGVRVLSSADPARREPDVFREVRSVSEQLQLDIDKVFEMQDRGDDEALFKYIILKQCNALHEVLPFMFEKINDYSELLFPNNLLVEDSVIRQMITSIPEEDWQEVEIIGWLYQFYVSEKKDEVFAGLKKNKKIAKENIPAATQLFTPKWIVQYMVENSVGRLWQESHPESNAAESWRYYLEPVEQEPEVQAKLDALRNPNLKPEDITVMDPACGSGHILVYAFDVLYQLYEERGYLSRDISALILKNNLFGLEIDDRAAQLASFALVMKARSKSPDLLNRSIIPNIISIQESEGLKDSFFYTGLDTPTKKVVDNLIKMYADAKNYGSILTPEIENLNLVKDALDESRQKSNLGEHDDGLTRLETLIQQTELLTKKYDVVITNPPYMGGRGMNGSLSQHLKNHYPDTKGDLFAVFMERMQHMTKVYGYHVTVTMQSWMFLSSYEKFREQILGSYSIIGLTHMANMVMGIAFGTAATVLQKGILGIKGICQYVERDDLEDDIPKQFPVVNGRYSIADSTNFTSIPGLPIAYWVSDKVFEAFCLTPLSEIGYSFQGIITGDVGRFLKHWHEIGYGKIKFGIDDSRFLEMADAFFPYIKGGTFRRWYGNLEFVIDWRDNGAYLVRSRTENRHHFFKAGITWSLVTSSNLSFRWFDSGYLCDVAGSSYFVDDVAYDDYFVLGFLNSKVCDLFLKVINPTINLNVKDVLLLPVTAPKDEVTLFVKENVALSKTDWDSFETSWDFQRHPMLAHKDGSSIEQAFNKWSGFAEEQFRQLKANEEDLNRIFIEIYGLEDELTPEVADDDITIRRADRERDVRSFISYAVGCMFGRYSLDEEGLVYAGGDFDSGRYRSFPVVEDNILTILDDEYFDNDIVSRFVDFVKVTFGTEMLEQNLEYIANSLRRSASDTARETIRKYFLRDFYPDHTRIYKKRPIYWLFSSPKGGFNSLVYMHRYDRDTVARIRTDYLLAFQDKLSAEEMQLRQLLTTDLTAREKTAASNRLKEIEKVMNELTKYQELIHNLANRREEIDLDNGVAVNYAKFQDVLAKIR